VNVVDSCGWLAYFTQDNTAEFFAPVLQNTDQLLVPSIVVYEVSKRIEQLFGQSGMDKAMPYLKLGRFVSPDWDVCVQAARTAKTHKLHMADALIWQTAQAHGAMLYTQDAALAHLPGVKYQVKK
jgi:toxin FitB